VCVPLPGWGCFSRSTSHKPHPDTIPPCVVLRWVPLFLSNIYARCTITDPPPLTRLFHSLQHTCLARVLRVPQVSLYLLTAHEHTSTYSSGRVRLTPSCFLVHRVPILFQLTFLVDFCATVRFCPRLEFCPFCSFVLFFFITSPHPRPAWSVCFPPPCAACGRAFSSSVFLPRFFDCVTRVVYLSFCNTSVLNVFRPHPLALGDFTYYSFFFCMSPMH